LRSRWCQSGVNIPLKPGAKIGPQVPFAVGLTSFAPSARCCASRALGLWRVATVHLYGAGKPIRGCCLPAYLSCAGVRRCPSQETQPFG
jgi:hypothetical protein